MLATADAWEGSFASVPTIMGPDNRPWEIKVSGRNLVLRYPVGLTLIVR